MRYLLSIFLLFVCSKGQAQITFNKTRHDFGELQAYDDRFVDIILTNKGEKKAYVLTVKKPYDVVYITDGKFMDKDSSVILRFQVNPKAKGRFNYEIEVYTSDKDESTKIKLVGNLTELSQDNTSAFTNCPDFSSRPKGNNANKFQLTVVTIDQVTKEELQNSNVTLIQNGQPIWKKETDKDGKIKEDATLGFSYFYAKHNGYLPKELGAYVNFQRNYIVIELQKDPNLIVETKPVDVPKDTLVSKESNEQIEINIEELLKEESPTMLTTEVPVEFENLEPDNFSSTYFKPVNVVFVLDVSSSMKQGDRIELMKYALFQLTDMLRPEDRFGIVTYSSNAQVLLKPTSGDDKEKIKSEVAQLNASGFTAGGEGIKLGFKQAQEHFINDGLNQIIVITDGAFNRNSDDYKKYIKKYKRKGISMSVVGIKIKEVDEKEMRQAAELGGGNFIPINKLIDAQENLKKQIRISSFKR